MTDKSVPVRCRYGADTVHVPAGAGTGGLGSRRLGPIRPARTYAPQKHWSKQRLMCEFSLTLKGIVSSALHRFQPR